MKEQTYDQLKKLTKELAQMCHRDGSRFSALRVCVRLSNNSVNRKRVDGGCLVNTFFD